MRVLVACEFSGVVRRAFEAEGHIAYSCDLLPSDDNSPMHLQGDVLTVLDSDWDLMIAHPPCTYMTNAGVRHLHDSVADRAGGTAKVAGSKRWVALFEAAVFFNALLRCPIPRIAVENPIPHKYAKALVGDYTQRIQPWQFGHGETKATCLWLKNLPHLVPTNVVAGREPRVHHEPPGPDRWKNRSRTLQGIADAMAEQWAPILLASRAAA